jgi:hypothetical protein
MASARHAAVKEAHCEMIASEELSTAQTDTIARAPVSLATVDVLKVNVLLTLG